MIKTERFNNAFVASKKIESLCQDDIIEVTVKYKIDVEKELTDIKGNIGDALITARNSGKESSMRKSLISAKNRIELLLDNEVYNNKYSEFMLNEFKGLKAGSNVKVIDDGEQYTGYIEMAEALVNNFNLSRDVLYSYIENRDSIAEGEEGVILAIGKHIDGHNDVLALVSLDDKCILIAVDGLELLT